VRSRVKIILTCSYLDSFRSQIAADYNISANVTALLPPGMRFINSTTKPLQTDSGNTSLLGEGGASGAGTDSGASQGSEIKWSIKKIDAGKKKSISFLAEAERDGLFNTRVQVRGSSTQSSDQLYADSNAIIIIGKSIFESKIDYGPECLSCDEDGLTAGLQTAQAGIPKELRCCA